MTEFDPKKYLIKVDGKDYLPVAARVYWFRQDHPDYAILTTELCADEEKGVYRVECAIRNEAGDMLASGRGRESRADFPKGPYEKAETIAIGRALANLGYGTMESKDFAEGDGKIADAPIGDKPNTSPPATADQPQAEGDLVCSWPQCGKAITKAVAISSKHNYDRYLCADHQKEATPNA